MTHVFIQGMPGGWAFGYRNEPDSRLMYPERPVFVRFHSTLQIAEERTPVEVARMTEGREVYHQLKRWQDHADVRMRNDANREPMWRAIDKARVAMCDELKNIGAWDPMLLETGVKS